jgi:DNA-binding transcriptional ArsR family regulator
VPPEDRFEDIADEAMLRTLTHPTRLRIMVAMSKAEASAKELAELFGQTIGSVSYHVRALQDAGLIQPTRRTRRRGAIETHYRARAPLEFSDEAWERLPVAFRRAMIEATIAVLAEDACDAVSLGGWDHPDALAQRHPLRVDDAGLREVACAARDFMDRVRDIARRFADHPERETLKPANVVVQLYLAPLEHGRNAALAMGDAVDGIETSAGGNGRNA